MFGKREEDPVAQEVLDEIRELSKRVAGLQGERDALKDARKLEAERIELREQLETLRIEKARKEEDHKREKREVEHATGLFRKQSEWERAKAVDEARLAVREENLSAERERFEQQMAFHKEQISGEIDRFEGLLTELLKRLPTVTVNQNGREPAATPRRKAS